MALDNSNLLQCIFEKLMKLFGEISQEDINSYIFAIGQCTDEELEEFQAYQQNWLKNNPNEIEAYVKLTTSLSKASCHRATRDGLTGVYNKSYFYEQLATELKRINREYGSLDKDYAKGSLIVIDLRSFKKINDQYGHQAGDKALIVVADSLRQIFNRPGDIIARMGGDEMAILLPKTSMSNALRLVNKINERFNFLGGLEFNYHGTTIHVHLSPAVRELNPNLSPSANYEVVDQASIIVKALQYQALGIAPQR